MDLTAHATAFINALRGTEEDDRKADRQRVEFVGQLGALVTAWQSLSRNYLDPPPSRQVFKDVFERLIDDTQKLILDLGKWLSNANRTQKRARSASRFYRIHTSSHILVTFFGQDVVHLRQKQILYATAVIELITLVVM